MVPLRWAAMLAQDRRPFVCSCPVIHSSHQWVSGSMTLQCSRDLLTLQWGLLTFAIRQLDCLLQARTSNQTGAGLNDSASMNHAELRSQARSDTSSAPSQARRRDAVAIHMVFTARHHPMPAARHQSLQAKPYPTTRSPMRSLERRRGARNAAVGVDAAVWREAVT
jgi:hypothetical protein